MHNLPVYLDAKVVKDDGLGTKSEFKTARVEYTAHTSPYAYFDAGVYAGQIKGIWPEHYHKAVIMVKEHPQNGPLIVEAHVLGGEYEDLYDKKIEVILAEKLHDEPLSDNLDEATQQLKKDIEDADMFFLENSVIE